MNKATLPLTLIGDGDGDRKVTKVAEPGDLVIALHVLNTITALFAGHAIGANPAIPRMFPNMFPLVISQRKSQTEG
ncbi:Cyclin-B1-5 isoform E [Glycine soja]|uniref:Cyclin-B1-5 isoform E n=1 Tax=Glycine soja TaxID=3848 RepID=A0A445JXS1_GLYSO|nr:Cyclin-B1-5 isoform E [Glycine soja]